MATYDEAIEWLDINYPFFLTLIINLGKPVYDPSVPTACVRDAPKSTGWEFVLNPTYFDDMTPSEMAGVISHETLHIALDHLFEVKQTDIWPVRNALLVAHEVIINDRLINEGFNMPDGDKKGLYGPDVLQIDTSEMSIQEVYDEIVSRIPPQPEPLQIDTSEDTENNEDKNNEQGNQDSSQSSIQSSSSGSSQEPNEDSVSNSDETSGKGGNNAPDNSDESTESEDKPSGSNSSQDAENNDEPKKETNGSGSRTDEESDASKSSEENNSQDKDESDGESENLESLAEHSCGRFDYISEENIQEVKQKLQEAINNMSQEEINSISDDLQQSLGAGDTGGAVTKSSTAGTEKTLTIEQTADKLGIKFAWAKLLAEVNPDLLKEKGRSPAKYRPSWRTPRRSLAHMYPDIMVPTMIARGSPQKKASEGDSKPLIVLALDFSQSIPRHLTIALTELAHSVPEDLITVECCTFSTKYYEFDPSSTNNHLASGGTDFSAVELFAREAAKKHKVKYPSAVICLTDGEADFYGENYWYTTIKNIKTEKKPTQEQLEKNWTWVLLQSHDRLKVNSMRYNPDSIKRLYDFT